MIRIKPAYSLKINNQQRNLERLNRIRTTFDKPIDQLLLLAPAVSTQTAEIHTFIVEVEHCTMSVLFAPATTNELLIILSFSSLLSLIHSF